MMNFCIAFPFPVPFSEWVTSAERYWVILAKHRKIDTNGHYQQLLR